MPRRPKFEGMTLQQKLKAMTPRSRVRLLARARKIRDRRQFEASLLNQIYGRNSPVDREEVSIHCGEIRTVPVNACKLDADGYPVAVDYLFEDLFAELRREYEEEESRRREGRREEEARLYEKAYEYEKVENGGNRIIRVKSQEAADLFQLEMKVKSFNLPPSEEPSCDVLVTGVGKCRACDKHFFYTFGHSRMRFCSDPCIAAGERAVVTDYVQRRSDSRERGRRNKCEQCGGPLESSRSSRRYCSGRCRTAAHRGGGKVDLQELGLL
jgi:hypothetical protein